MPEEIKTDAAPENEVENAREDSRRAWEKADTAIEDLDRLGEENAPGEGTE